MNTVDKVIIEYNNLVKLKIKTLRTELVKATRNRQLAESYILKYQDKVYNSDILKYIKAVTNQELKYRRLDIEALYSHNDLGYDLIRKGTLSSDEARITVNYYKSFKEYVLSEMNLLEDIDKFKRYRIHKYTIGYIFRYYFKLIGRQLLSPKCNSFSLPYDVHLKIVGKDRKKIAEKYRFKRKINWGESIRVLKAIAKESHIDIYNKYIKDGKRNELIEAMKPHTYNKVNNPNGKKWLIQVKDYNFWLVIWSRYSKLENIANYSIVPTNFVANATRSQIDFCNSAESESEIINTTLLGFRDKIRVLERYNFNYCLNNWENDIQAS